MWLLNTAVSPSVVLGGRACTQLYHLLIIYSETLDCLPPGEMALMSWSVSADQRMRFNIEARKKEENNINPGGTCTRGHLASWFMVSPIFHLMVIRSKTRQKSVLLHNTVVTIVHVGTTLQKHTL